MPDLSSKKQRLRKDYGYHLDYRLRWSDNDMYGHTNNTIYGNLIDSITNAYLIQHCNLSPTSPSSSQIGLVVNSYCDYFGSISYPAVAECGLRVVRMGKTSVMYEVGVFEQESEQVKAVGGFTHVFVTRDGRRAAVGGMEEGLRKGLERLMVTSAPAGAAARNGEKAKL